MKGLISTGVIFLFQDAVYIDLGGSQAAREKSKSSVQVGCILNVPRNASSGQSALPNFIT